MDCSTELSFPWSPGKLLESTPKSGTFQTRQILRVSSSKHTIEDLLQLVFVPSKRVEDRPGEVVDKSGKEFGGVDSPNVKTSEDIRCVDVGCFRVLEDEIQMRRLKLLGERVSGLRITAW